MKLNFYLIRGLSRESGHWGDFLFHLSDEFPDATLHLIDLPGSGKHHNDSSPASIPKIVDFIRRNTTFNDHEKNIVLSSSLGGIVAMDWVMRFPSEFDGIVMMNSTFKPICNNSERVKPKIRFKLVQLLLSSNIEKREKIMLYINSNKKLITNDLLMKWVEIQKNRKMTNWNIFMQTVAGHRYKIKATKVPIPLLILGSKNDKLVCPSCLKKTHEILGGKLKWHETAGHCIPLDEPIWVSKQIKNWLSNEQQSHENTRNWSNK